MEKTSPRQELETVSRGEYREILLARMAGGDLYANEILLKVRRIDKALDLFRETPLYGKRSLRKD